MTQRLRIAIVGTGISGLAAAYRLHREHDLTIFESSDWVGGHTHTIDVPTPQGALAIDTGFIVFNHAHYPLFSRLLEELRVESRPTHMSFSVRCDATNLEYSGGSFTGLFAQRRNLLRPRFWRLLRDLMRFHRESVMVLKHADDDLTVDEYLRRESYSTEFARAFLIPMGAALWSCPPGTFASFPIRFVVEFFRNHDMLQCVGRPTWRVVRGGSRTYVDRLIQPFHDRIRLNCRVLQVQRDESGVTVHSLRGVERFGHVVLACHSDQALALLGDADALERSTLSAFAYQANDVTLHSDASLLPRRRRAWAAWNYALDEAAADRPATLTYNMNILQSLATTETYCVSLNSTQRIDPSKVIARFTYHHPIYNHRRESAWRRQPELACRRRTSFCGAYWGYGFHEDGVRSAYVVCDAIQRSSSTPAAQMIRNSSVDETPLLQPAGAA